MRGSLPLRGLLFISSMVLVAAVAGYGGYVATLRFQPVPPVPDSLPLRVQKDLRELRQCMEREMAVWDRSQRQAWENPDGPLRQEMFSEQRRFFQQERAMAQCVAMQQKGKKQPGM